VVRPGNAALEPRLPSADAIAADRRIAAIAGSGEAGHLTMTSQGGRIRRVAYRPRPWSLQTADEEQDANRRLVRSARTEGRDRPGDRSWMGPGLGGSVT
jgi:hypothetical protein